MAAAQVCAAVREFGLHNKYNHGAAPSARGGLTAASRHGTREPGGPTLTLVVAQLPVLGSGQLVVVTRSNYRGMWCRTHWHH